LLRPMAGLRRLTLLETSEGDRRLVVLLKQSFADPGRTAPRGVRSL
jgi:hypothetical protein